MGRVASSGLRERKKQQTRQLIADAAAALFSQRGYDNVAVIDVARAADVSEQTVYNYFPSKERLVLDRDAEFEQRLAEVVRERGFGITPAAAIRGEALALVARVGDVPADQARGGLIYLAHVSPMLRLRCLEMTERHAQAIADAIAVTAPSPLSPAVAKLQGFALAWVFQTVIDEAGRRFVAHVPVKQITQELASIVAEMLASLDDWIR